MDAATIANFVMDFDVSEEKLAELTQFISDGKLEEFGGMSHEPVGIIDFIEDKEFLNAKGVLYPAVLREMKELNSGNYVEAVLTGAIGTGKTTIALYTTAYQLYLLSCMHKPHAIFGLDPASEILMIFQSITEKLAKSVDYMRFKSMIDNSPYFKAHFPYDNSIESEMRFPNRIIVKPVSGADTAAIGQNVMGGIIDELNYMALVENSKASVDGGTYDQAVAVYNSISRRRKSRFMNQGKLPGILCLVSSKRYPGQFTDVKEEEALTDKTIFVYNKRVWDIKPDAFIGDWFKVFPGDETRKPRILEPKEKLSDEDLLLVEDIPVEYRTEFEHDIINALREIAGLSTLAKHPFMMETEAVANCFGTHHSILSRDDVDFVETQLEIYPKRFEFQEYPRWAHLDLAVTGDSVGLAVGCVTGFESVKRSATESERLPTIRMDFTLEIKPPKGGEIKFFKIRSLLYKLRELGLAIKWVSFDSYQSRDSIQILRQKGFMTGEQSMDKNTTAYDITKAAFYDGRVEVPEHERALHEMISLERDVKRGKVDHPPNGSKDVADAIAGVVYGLTMRKEIWIQHGVPIFELPPSITEAIAKGRDNMKSDALEVVA